MKYKDCCIKFKLLLIVALCFILLLFTSCTKKPDENVSTESAENRSNLISEVQTETPTVTPKSTY